jgi:hypothetical protein
MTSQNEDTRKQDELELDVEEIKDLDVDEKWSHEVLGGNSHVAGPTRGTPTT